jgi:hypothetical protein
MRHPALPALSAQVQRKGADCNEDEPQVQGKASSLSAEKAATPPSEVHSVLASQGRPLDPASRAFFEPRFGQDFRHVRVHDDAAAAQSSKGIGALAYTVGRDIVFSSGWRPETTAGAHLLAHELTHVIQQGAAERWIQRALDDAAKANRTAPTIQPPKQAPSAAPTGAARVGAPAGGPPLNFEFNAFIPGSLGRPFASYDHPRELRNQATFDADIGAIPGTWKKEPGSFATFRAGAWYYETDNRDFGGGSHRVGFNGSVPRGDIGALASHANLFTHSTSGSTRVRWTHTGTFSSRGEVGSVDGPYSRSATVTSSENRTDDASSNSTVTTTGEAAYPFRSSPDIKYAVVLGLRREPTGRVALTFTITNRKFPYYELLVDGRLIWKYTSASTGPGLINLHRSDTSTSPRTWYF